MPSYKAEARMPLAVAQVLAAKFSYALGQHGISRTEVSGSIRRQEKTIGDIDLIVEGDLSRVGEIPGVEIKEGGSERVTVVYEGQQINIFRAEDLYWGAMMMYLSGPTGATIAYRQKAAIKGYLLNQYGLFDKDRKKIAGETEEGIFQAIGHTMKPPELRGKKR